MYQDIIKAQGWKSQKEIDSERTEERKALPLVFATFFSATFLQVWSKSNTGSSSEASVNWMRERERENEEEC